MSLQALHTAATGMEAYQFKLDNTANNLANAGTTAFKRQRVNFEDLFYQHYKLPGAQDAQGNLTPTGVALGLGTRVQSTAVEHTQGSLIETNQQFDVAIEGDGFFQVQDGNETLYTRAGNFTINDQGQLVLQSANKGRLTNPPISIPNTYDRIQITSDGNVNAFIGDQDTPTNLGTITTARFINPQGLIQRGENLYAVSAASGDPSLGTPGEDGRGMLIQGFLEASNVEPVRELVDLIKTQRNFELNSQVLQAADQTLQLVANLRRF
ncbi:MAG: flagellar basal-body rod protein FlgG [Planctomycetaceae bacterium]|nr:flagellar basal-body rod protein FlgG [Planctomycetaceae bacterium]